MSSGFSKTKDEFSCPDCVARKAALDGQADPLEHPLARRAFLRETALFLKNGVELSDNIGFFEIVFGICLAKV